MRADYSVDDKGRSIVSSYSVSLAAKTIGVSPRQLYYWEVIGIVAPVYERFGSYAYRRYSQEDVGTLMKIKCFLDKGYTLRAAAQMVKSEARNGSEGQIDLQN